MSERPQVKPGDSINIGKNLRAIICNIYDNNSDIVEVVYLNGNKAINEDAVWNDECWEFVHKGQVGGYADNYDRLKPYVNILRRGY